jgi:hypothetical protein
MNIHIHVKYRRPNSLHAAQRSNAQRSAAATSQRTAERSNAQHSAAQRSGYVNAP